MPMKFENVLTEYWIRGLRIHDIEQFLEEGGSIDHLSDTGETLLHYAAGGSDTNVVQFLVGKKANLNIQDEQDNTPLHLAVDSDIDYAVQREKPLKMSTVIELINAGADEKLKDDKGRTARDIAACYGRYAIDFYDSISRIRAPDKGRSRLNLVTLNKIMVLRSRPCGLRKPFYGSPERRNMEEIYTPFENCGWKSAEDGTCSHPNNATPECHQFICPIKARPTQRAGDVCHVCGAKVVKSKSNVMVGRTRG